MFKLLLLLAVVLWLHGSYGNSIVGKSRFDEETERMEKGCALLILLGLGIALLGHRVLRWW